MKTRISDLLGIEYSILQGKVPGLARREEGRPILQCGRIWVMTPLAGMPQSSEIIKRVVRLKGESAT